MLRDQGVLNTRLFKPDIAAMLCRALSTFKRVDTNWKRPTGNLDRWMVDCLEIGMAVERGITGPCPIDKTIN